ncbi:MAG TPA: PIN domain-containing protein [Vicinamibacteria bacterium]|nr:PIN domain-containing protein [Vicinamibacteria bacterium]
MKTVLLDTGPIVAYLSANDTHHAWAVAALGQLRPPLLTCEPVLAEAVYLLRGLPGGAASVFELIHRGAVTVGFRLAEELEPVQRVIARYGATRTDLADACLVRMSELHAESVVVTIDSQFRDVYRRLGRKVIPTMLPRLPRRRST